MAKGRKTSGPKERPEEVAERDLAMLLAYKVPHGDSPEGKCCFYCRGYIKILEQLTDDLKEEIADLKADMARIRENLL